MSERKKIVGEIQKIVFDCERMKYPHTGLYHFCQQLGNALLKEVRSDEEIVFYTSKKNMRTFGTDSTYLTQKWFHKLVMPSVAQYKVWHVMHQQSMYHPSAKKIPVVLTVHDLNFLKGTLKNEGKRKFYLSELQKRIDQAHYIVAISNYVLNDLKAHIDIGMKPHSVIYNGCNVSALQTLKEPLIIPRKPFLFSIGTVTEKKNFHVLPRLLKNTEFSLLLSGVIQDEEYKKMIIDEAKALGVLERIYFTGPISENDKQWYYTNCVGFVFPSIAEGFGLPVIEAMAKGKPVFLSSLTSLPEIGDQYAFYFSDFTMESMQKTLEEGLRIYVQNNMRESIITHAKSFDWSITAKKYLDIYRSFY